ncbi:MAG TPA: DUF6531 domain-containing protein, partial [Acidimicrobiales bacterium]|nr:DUF6531 domain-containing protein [Acidimicrobiales bacterium]
MPELGAIHEDVQFDWLAASDLSAELRATAVVLETQLGDRDVARRDARLWWQGRYGDEFDQRVASCVADAGRFVLSLRDAADRLDELARLARQEQDRRTQAREWEASQDDGGGGGLMGTINDAVDTVDDFLTGEDDLPPPPPPVEPPLIPLYDPGPTVREVSLPPLAPSGSGVGVPASGFVGGGRGGGVSSGEPAALDTWVTSSRGSDEAVLTRKGTLDGLHGDFTATLGWGSFDASSLLGGMGTWLTWNGTDALWVATVAQAFRDAGTGTVSDAVIAAQVDAAGLDGTRTAVTYDSPAAWGEPPTSGYADDPVNTASGNFVEAEVDLEVGGLARLLRFTRTYNSRSDRVGAFGPGWSSWASVRLRAEPDGAHWVGPDGQEVVVPRSSAGEYPRVVGLAGLVVPEGDGLALAALGGGSRLVFDAAGHLRRADAGPGTEVRFVHDGDRLVELRHEGGRSVRLEWEGDRVVAVRCSDGRSVTYAYDEGRLVSASGGARGLRGYEVDERGRVVAVTDADGVVEVRNRYDDDGRVVEQLSPFGRRSRYRYLGGRVTVVDDAEGPANSYVHDDRGRLVGAIDGHGHELRKAYDRWGNPVRVTERDGTATLLEWDDRSRLVRREAADGSWFAFDHDDQGRLLATAASTGATTRFRYEGVERTPVEVVDPEGGVTRLDVHDGLVHRLVDPDGVELRFGFDAHGELTSITDGLGNTATFERDEAGRVVATESPTGHRTEQAYDPAGRIVARRDGADGADGAEWRYEWSAAGRLRAVVDPLGARRELRFGSHGEAEQVVDELGHATTLRFDPLGNLVGVVLPGSAKWAFEYDGLCRLTGVDDPAGATWLREYDVAGRLVGTVDPVGARRGVALDGVGRIAAVDDSLTSVAFAYDPLGRAAVHRRPDGTEARATYDRCGRVTSVTDPDGGVTRYEHTPAGRLAAVTSPLGHTTRCEYDAAGRRVAVVDPSGRRWVQRHDGDGRVTRVVAPTGDTVRFRYGGGGRLV